MVAALPCRCLSVERGGFIVERSSVSCFDELFPFIVSLLLFPAISLFCASLLYCSAVSACFSEIYCQLETLFLHCGIFPNVLCKVFPERVFSSDSTTPVPVFVWQRCGIML
eukprot:RCo005917